MITKFFGILIVFLSGLCVMGNIYFWTDENGIQHYSNVSSPENQSVQELEETRAVYQTLNLKKNLSQTFLVLKVYDGDTVQVKGVGLVFKVRLAGIDAPEIGYKGQPSQPFCQKSKQYLQRLVNQKQVRLKSHGIGGYNRQLAEIFVGDVNVNLEMIRQGLAEVYEGKHPRNFDSDLYWDTQKKARKAKIGMWVQSSSYKSPRQWRKEHPRNQ